MTKVNFVQAQVPNTSTELDSVTQTGAIHAACVCNTSASPVTLQIWIAKDGGAAADGNKIYDALSIDANTEQTLGLLVNQSLPTGAKIYAQASAASALTLTIDGVQ